jgi:hypothetical protein
MKAAILTIWRRNARTHFEPVPTSVIDFRVNQDLDSAEREFSAELSLINGVPKFPKNAPLSEDSCRCHSDFFEEHGTAGIDKVDLFPSARNETRPGKWRGQRNASVAFLTCLSSSAEQSLSAPLLSNSILTVASIVRIPLRHYAKLFRPQPWSIHLNRSPSAASCC